uniref:Putative basic tail protein n=1 Tax=Ixodes ricinus TaxID=34613 RepID=A0A0K8RJI2_IXORI
MMAAQLLIVIVACLGQITCAELDPLLKRCEDKVFDDPGYSLGCTYTCKSGNRSDDTEYWGTYYDATVCVASYNFTITEFLFSFIVLFVTFNRMYKT